MIDDYNFVWMDAWDLVRKVLNYTNHTLLPRIGGMECGFV